MLQVNVKVAYVSQREAVARQLSQLCISTVSVVLLLNCSVPYLVREFLEQFGFVARDVRQGGDAVLHSRGEIRRIEGLLRAGTLIQMYNELC